MNTESSTVTAKGQVTVPRRLRDALGLKPGDVARFEPMLRHDVEPSEGLHWTCRFNAAEPDVVDYLQDLEGHTKLHGSGRVKGEHRDPVDTGRAPRGLYLP